MTKRDDLGQANKTLGDMTKEEDDAKKPGVIKSLEHGRKQRLASAEARELEKMAKHEAGMTGKVNLTIIT